MIIAFRSRTDNKFKNVTMFDEEAKGRYIMGSFKHHIAIYWNEDETCNFSLFLTF